MYEARRYFFKICKNGHTIYNAQNPSGSEYCQMCGALFVEKCPNCECLIDNTFVGRPSMLFAHPQPFPAKPKFCGQCGKAFPWTVKNNKKIEDAGFWGLMHPRVVQVSKSRFTSGHHADAVESAFKDLNEKVKKIYKTSTGEERDGSDLMRKAFSSERVIIKLENLNTESGKNVQRGFAELYSGVMMGIRNPAAHSNLEITAERAIHCLMLASLLFYRLEERRRDV